MPYLTIREIKEANANAGHHFFEPATMRFFRSRVLRGVIGGKYFVTSERREYDTPRCYSVRVAHDNGHIDTVGEFCGYDTPAQARAAARKLAAQEPSNSAPCADCGRWTLKRELSAGLGNAGYCPTCAAGNE